jgi:PAS domain S-box-containing protein
VLPVHYDLALVALSILMAICGAYAGLELAGRVKAAKGHFKAVWILGGASAWGTAVWSMHYIGMLAFRVPVEVRYDVSLVLISMVAAITAAGIALIFISQKQLNAKELAAGALAMGTGIASMNYIGMAAMRMTCTLTYNPWLVLLSILIAVLVSGIALTSFRSGTHLAGCRKAGAAILLGVAISSTHYIGMAAVHFWQSDALGQVSKTVDISWLGGIAIATGALLLLTLAVATSLLNKYVSAQSVRLYSTEERYRVLFERSLAGIYVSSLDGTVIDMNDACINLLGYKSREDVIGRKVRNVHLPKDLLKTYSELLETTKQFPARETRLFRKDGSVVWVVLNATLLEFQDGSPPEIHGMLSSIDEWKHTEDELRLAKYSAESANLSKSQFLANMSHELRTPLNGVLGMTQLLADTVLSQEQKEYVSVARSSAESLLGLINHILEFSTTEVARAVSSNEEFDIRKLLSEEVSWAVPLASEKGLRLRCEVSPHVAERFRGEPRWIRQIASALLSNALRFTLHGEIVVRLVVDTQSERDQTITISVHDTGVGIPPEKQAAVFEPFTQVDNSNTRRFGGTGLGLAIVRNLVDAMGGRLSVESHPGKGSVFSVQIPLLTHSGNIPATPTVSQPHSLSKTPQSFAQPEQPFPNPACVG